MRDRERAAKILAKADSLPGPRSKVDQLVAAEEKVAIRSIRRWRTKLGKDAELTRLYTIAKAPLVLTATEQFERAQLKMLDLVVESAEAVNPKSPRALVARTKALAAISDARRSEKIQDAWFALNKPDAQTVEQFAPRVEFDFEVEAEPEQIEGEVSAVEQAPEASVVNS